MREERDAMEKKLTPTPGVGKTPRSIKPNLVYVGENAMKLNLVPHAAKRAELRTFLAIPWCGENWIPRGDFTKCPKEGSNSDGNQN